MKRVHLAPGIWHLQSGSNMGLGVQDGKGLLIDAGLDKDAARRALRALDELNVALAGLFLTHAHADHFGGAHVVQRRTEARTYAPILEAAMMEHPLIEPLYLFGGAAPIAELCHKFTLAEPCQVDQVMTAPGPLQIGPLQVEAVPLPGHSPHQMGVAVGDVLFCADALFPIETLEKHHVTFCVDLDRTLETLERLPTLPYAHFAPGHGPAYAAGEEIARVCAANRERLEQVRALVYDALDEPHETPALVRHVADHYGLRLKTATSYFLTRTTVLAALSSLERAGEASVAMKGNHLWWQKQ
ncbi:MAG TPA: MBL fold metallo-hydrolase [Chloroflexi bacterium]|nr:MBL fold metallo-hydrolase [Chloroflexota bacterium]